MYGISFECYWCLGHIMRKSFLFCQRKISLSREEKTIIQCFICMPWHFFAFIYIFCKLNFNLLWISTIIITTRKKNKWKISFEFFHTNRIILWIVLKVIISMSYFSPVIKIHYLTTVFRNTCDVDKFNIYFHFSYILSLYHCNSSNFLN